MNVGPGRKQTVTERGWFAPPFTACRFAVIAQIAVRMGYDVPLDRQPEGVDNFVYDLQLAGDNTPRTGSTMRQGQKSVAALLPDAPYFFGTMTDAEVLDAVNRGATVGFAVDMGKMPRYLRNFCGFLYTGGHYMAIDGAYPDDTVDLSDPMYRPAAEAQPRKVPWSDVSPAVVRNNAGDMIVTLGFADAAYLPVQLEDATQKIASTLENLAELQAKADSIQARIDGQAV